MKYLVLLILIWANVLVWRSLAAGQSRFPEITFLDVGRNAALHVHIPRGYDVIAANSELACDRERLNRVITPYLAGEGVTSVDRWELLAYPDGVPGCGSDSGTSSLPDHFARPGLSHRQRDENAKILLYKSQFGIELIRIDFGGRSVAWLSDWELLDDPDSGRLGGIEILAFPYPYAPVSDHIAKIYRLGPQLVVIYNNSGDRGRTDIDFLAAELQSAGIEVIDTQKHGAVRLRLGREETVVTFSAAGS